MYRDFDSCVRAVQAKDARFDGWFFTAVRTTRIYCRPSCPVSPPKVVNMSFYPSAAAAQQAGYRACKRCRPDASPGSPQWNERADLVARAHRMIADGVVDREGVPGLAARLGYSVRQVQRQVQAELGAGPLALARAQRAQTARLLIMTTALSMSQIAFAAGFSSIRTFNDTVREVFALTPSELRGRAGRDATGAAGTIALRLPYRLPLSLDALSEQLAADPLPGVQEWRDGTFRRTLRTPHGYGIVELSIGTRPAGGHLDCRLSLHDLRDLTFAINRCRWLLDLDADPVAIDAMLSADPVLAPLVAARPGVRVVRAVDGVEQAVREILGPVATAALVSAYGQPIADEGGGLTVLFPDLATLSDVDTAVLGCGGPREKAFVALVEALAGGQLDLGVGADWMGARARLAELPEVEPAVVERIVMRALGDPDAWPLSSAAPGGWRPWRSYAAAHLAG